MYVLTFRRFPNHRVLSYEDGLENLNGKDHLGELGADWRMSLVLKCILNSVGGCERDLSGSGEGPVLGTWKHGTEPSRSKQDGEFHDYLSDYLPSRRP
jgi:hypothetical protein